MLTEDQSLDLEKKRNTYTGKFKAEVVFMALEGDKTLKELATDYQLHPNQIKNWKSLLKKKAEVLFEDKRRKKAEL
jgi:transposase